MSDEAPRGEAEVRRTIRADQEARGLRSEWDPVVPPVTSHWRLLRVSSGMERKVRDALGPKTEEHPHGAGLNVYVPVEKYRPRRNTWKSRTRPLIPGYIFAELPDEEALDTARKNHAVRDVMCLDGLPLVVPAIAVASLILMEACGEYDATWGAPAPVRDKRRGLRPLKNWAKGQRVQVVEGPFASFPAFIEKADRADRIEVLVAIFGRITPVTLDEEMLGDDGSET